MHTCMCADVSPEQPWSGESLATCGAHTRQSVWANVHFQGSEAGVLFRAVFAVEGWACRRFSSQRLCLLQWGTVGELVLGHLMLRQCREAAVALTAVQTVVNVLDDVRTGGIWCTAAVLLFLAAAAGGRAAEVQGTQRWRGQRHWSDWGQRCR